jgi:GNAT superfamily N-acetyltransferase
VATLRPATPDDADRVAGVWQAAWHDGHRGHVPEALIEARDAAYFGSRAAELVDHITVAVDGAELLGVLIVRDDELMQLMVTAMARGHGVGGLLLAEAERQVAEAGHDEVWLAVVPGNTAARLFYESHGWVDRGLETYDAVTLGGGTVAVPVRRCVKRLAISRQLPLRDS